MSGILAPLWQLDETLIALLDTVATCPPEMEAELAAEVEKYLGAEMEKVDQCAHVLAALEYEEKCAADEITRLRDRAAAAFKSKNRLEQYLCRIIAARGGKPLKGNTNTLSVRTSEAVVILDEAAVPVQYIVEKTTVTRTPDKALIKKSIKAGEDVLGARLEFRNNLQRK